MGLNVQVDLEAYPKGTPLGIVGIGVVNNGEGIEVDPGMESVFYQTNGDTIQNVLADQEGMTVSGSPEFDPPKEDDKEVVISQATSSGLPTGLPQGTTETVNTPPEKEGE